jgi:RHS repeat-associated protein
MLRKFSVASTIAITGALIVNSAIAQGTPVERYSVVSSLNPGIVFESRREAEAAMRTTSAAASVLQLVDSTANKDVTTYSYAAVPDRVGLIRGGEEYRTDYSSAFSLQDPPYPSEEAVTQAVIDYLMSLDHLSPPTCGDTEVNINRDWFYLTPNWIYFPVYGHTDVKEIRINWWTRTNPDGTCFGPVPLFGAQVNIYRSYELTCPTGYTLSATGDFCENNLTATITEVNLDYDLKPEECVGNPCNPFTGSKILTFTDVQALGIQFTRTWRSRASVRTAYAGDSMQTADSGRMPYGWSYSYGQRVLFDDAGLPEALFRPDGSLVPVIEEALTPGVFFATDGSQKQLRQTSADSWTVYMPDGSSETYRQRTGLACDSGIVRLEAVLDATGLSTTVEYEDDCATSPTLVRGPFGHTVQFQYQAFVDSATPRSIEAVVDSSGRNITYGYSLMNDLSGASLQVLRSVTYQDNTVETYHYEDTSYPGFITGITDEMNIRLSTYTYDAAGRSATTGWAGGFNSWTFEYLPSGETQATDGRGIVNSYTVADDDGDGLGDRRIVSRDGVVIKNTTNDDLSQQRRESITTDNRLTSSFVFDDFHKVAMTESSAAETRFFEYEHLNDTSGLLRFERGPSSCDDGTMSPRQYEMETIYLPATQIVASVVERGFRKDGSGTCIPIERTVVYSNHNSFGQAGLIDGPRTDVVDSTTVTYNECLNGAGCGALASIENALGQRWTFDTYDTRGNLRRLTQPDGISIEHVYDLRNRLTSMIETGADGLTTRTTTVAYLDNGLVSRVTKPTGDFFDYFYDEARNLREIRDNFGDRVVYEYDLNGNRILEQWYDVSGVERKRRRLTYDSFDQVSGELYPATDGGPDDEWQWVTDAVGLLQSTTSPLGRVTHYADYDDFQNLITMQDADGGSTNLVYDARDNLISLSTPNNSTTSFEFDDFGNFTRETSPDRGVSEYTYDEAGNALSSLDARGLLTAISYDALNRVSMVDFNGSETVIYDYDNSVNSIGRLSSIIDSSGTTEWNYDAFGAVAQKIQTIGTTGLTTGYNYDAAGRLTTMTLPSGRVVTYSYDTFRPDTVEVDDNTILSGATYEPFGPVNGWTWGNGGMNSRQYNLRGLTESFTLAGDTRVLNYDADAFLTSAVDGRVDESYSYDSLGRLINYVPATTIGTVAGFTSAPVLLTSIQTMKNETGSVPNTPSSPWMTVATKNVTSGSAKVSLERGQVNTGSINVKEKIGYVAIDPVSGGSFLDSSGNTINYEAQTTPEFIKGWDTGCFETTFLNVYARKPIVIASLNSHNGGDGGWLRRCSLNRSLLGLTVDEDKFGDSERRHNSAESAALVAFSAAFDAVFADQNGIWGMETAKITLPSTVTTGTFTSVAFRQSYAKKPVVIALPTKRGSNPASVRIRNVTKNGFQIAQVEPAPSDGTHSSMTIHYLAIEPGEHTLPDGTRLDAGRKATMKQKHGSGVVGDEGWATIKFVGDMPSVFTQAFDYDTNGNRVSLTENGTTYGYGYAANSNRLLNAAGPVARNYSYDAAGNVISDGVRSFEFDARGRLVDFNLGEARYEYNGLGQRVHKNNGEETLFVYDEVGNLLGEYDSLGNSIRETVWFNGRPVSILNNAGIFYIHTDHIGTPRAITDGSTVVWRWESDAFGATSTEEDPDGDARSFTHNLRFPGQFYDEESGLHYNYHRTFDPSTGRYLESDPIGLGGGLNTYSYVNGDPLTKFDSFGLACNSQGCFPTQGETNAANSGDWATYYDLACAGGDPYACRAGEVARKEGYLARKSNQRVKGSILKNLPDDMCIEDKWDELADRLERIRIELAHAHNKALQGATPLDPRQLNRQDISDFHNDVFTRNGAGNVFGGDLWDRMSAMSFGLLRDWYEWCPSPSCRN